MTQPLVSVLIPVYNRKELIIETVESVCSQTVRDIEIIISDNCSTDGTWEICKHLANCDSRIRLFRNDHNLGQMRNWRVCLDHATGRYAKFVYSDDLIAPNHLECLVPFLDDPRVGIAFSAAQLGSLPDSSITVYSLAETPSLLPTDPILEELLFDGAAFLSGNGRLPHSPVVGLFRTEDLKSNTLVNFPSPTIDDFEIHAMGNDLAIYLLTVSKYPLIAYTPKVLTFLRIHEDSETIRSMSERPLKRLRCYQQVATWFLIQKNMAAPRSHALENDLGRLLAKIWIEDCFYRIQKWQPIDHLWNDLLSEQELSNINLSLLRANIARESRGWLALTLARLPDSTNLQSLPGILNLARHLLTSETSCSFLSNTEPTFHRYNDVKLNGENNRFRRRLIEALLLGCDSHSARPQKGQTFLTNLKNYPWESSPSICSSALCSNEKQILTYSATVIVSTYESENLFRGLLENLTTQTLFRAGDLEIVIVDSASPENEGAISCELQTLYPQQIVYYRTEVRETIYASWNRAVRMARSNYIINANADDRLRPDAIEVMARYLDEHPDVAMVYPYQLITDIPNETFETTQANRVFNWTTFNPEWLAQGYNLGSHLMWRASLHQKYGYFRPDLKSAGDYEFVLRIAKTEKIVCIPEVLGLYYNNQQGLSMNIAAALPETRRVQAEYGFHYNDVPLYQTQLSSHCRVLVITNLYPPQELGGYGRSLADFAAGLQSRGHQIYVLTSDAPYLGRTPDREDGIDRRLQLWGTYEGQTQELQDPNQINAIVAHNDRILREVLAQLQPDLCLVGNISFLGPAVFGPLLEQQIPTIHHLGFAQVPYPPTLAPQHPLYHLATASEAVAQAVRDSGLTQLATSTIYPGALVRQFSRPTLPQRDKLRILYAGLVIQTKGPHTLLEALTVLQQQQVDFECTIAGNAIHADYLAALQQYLQQTGLVHRVRLVGHLDRSQLADCFAQHNVFVFPSIQPEAFGIVQVEAMAAGLTVLSTGVGGASEVIESGVSGLLFPAGDAISLAQALISLPQDAERWARLAATGQAAAFAKFDIERSIDQLELKFEELLRRKAELSSPMALSIPTSPATDPYTQWLCDRITNVARVYGLDPNDQSTINLLRELRRQTAELWKAAPAEQLPDLYQGSVGQAYRALLHSGFQSQPLTGEEANYLQALTNQVSQHTVQHPVGLQAFLGVMLYLPAGKMKVDQAPVKLPAWLLSDYQSVFEPPGTVEPTSAPQPIAPPTSATVPLHQDMAFLNRLLGCANLYYIDPEETSIAEELRLIRQQVGQIWAQTPLEQLESLYKSEFGRRYLALLDSGYQNYPLRPEEESVVQELTGLISQGIDRYPGLNALLAIMMYLPPGKMQVRDAANRLPAWLLPDYQRIFEAGQATTAPLVPSPQPTVPTAAPTAAAPPAVSQPPNLAEDMVFLNRFLGCSNLYEIDPEDGETVAELRQLRQRVAEFWLTVPPSQLEAVFNSELGRRYGMYLKSGFQREPLTDGERELLVKLAETAARGFEQPGGLNAFLGAMMYYAPGQMQVKDAATRLPGWLFPLYAAVFESEAQKKMTS